MLSGRYPRPGLSAADDIHRGLMSLVLLDGIWLALGQAEGCASCRAGDCRAHEDAARLWAAYYEAADDIEGATGEGPGAISAATRRAVAAAARQAQAVRQASSHPIDQALAACWALLGGLS